MDCQTFPDLSKYLSYPTLTFPRSKTPQESKISVAWYYISFSYSTFYLLFDELEMLVQQLGVYIDPKFRRIKGVVLLHVYFEPNRAQSPKNKVTKAGISEKKAHTYVRNIHAST